MSVESNLAGIPKGAAVPLNPVNQAGPSVIGGDWNDIANTGFYFGATNQNAPLNDTSSWFFVMAQRHSDGLWITQTAIAYGNSIAAGRMFVRNKTVVGWTSWREILYDTNQIRLGDDRTIPRLGAGSDFNNILETGFYGVNGALNSPNDVISDWFYLINLVHDDKNYRQQIAITYGVGTMAPSRVFLRTDLASTWSPWIEMASVQAVTDAVAPLITRLNALEARVTALEG